MKRIICWLVGHIYFYQCGWVETKPETEHFHASGYWKLCENKRCPRCGKKL